MNKTIDDLTAKAQKSWLKSWEDGPKKTRWTEIPLQVGDKAPDFKLVDQKGRIKSLASFWEKQPALVLFWRHFGCECGMERAELLKEELSAYKEAGANVVIIAQGEPARSAFYASTVGLTNITFLSDPERKVYNAYGILEGKESQIYFEEGDEYLCRYLKVGQEMAASYAAKGVPLVDNEWILPSEFVVDTKSVVRLVYRYNYCDNYPEARVLVAAIREANGDFDRVK